MMLPAERVLSEMSELGLQATELGAPGFLPTDPAELGELLARHGLALIGAFVPLVLHRPSLRDAAREAFKTAELLASVGGEILVLAVVESLAWDRPTELSDEGWRLLAEHAKQIETLASDYGLTVALHPHVGTLIENADQIDRALDQVEVSWCLDTGHLLVGGVDPAEFARAYGERVVHVHLKDVDAALAAKLRAGELSLLEATRRGMFVPLGKGDARVAEVIEALDRFGYDRWFVLEQDTAITGEEPTVDGGPMSDVRKSIAFLHNSAQTPKEVI